MVRELNECRDVEIKDGKISNAIWRQLTVDVLSLVLGKKETASLAFSFVWSNGMSFPRRPCATMQL